MSFEELLEVKLRRVLCEELDRRLGKTPEVSGVEGLVSYATAAKLVEVEPETIGAWVREGFLKAYGKGRGLRRVRREELFRALEMSKAEAEKKETPDQRADAVLLRLTKRGG